MIILKNEYLDKRDLGLLITYISRSFITGFNKFINSNSKANTTKKDVNYNYYLRIIKTDIIIRNSDTYYLINDY